MPTGNSRLPGTLGCVGSKMLSDFAAVHASVCQQERLLYCKVCAHYCIHARFEHNLMAAGLTLGSSLTQFMKMLATVTSMACMNVFATLTRMAFVSIFAFSDFAACSFICATHICANACSTADPTSRVGSAVPMHNILDHCKPCSILDLLPTHANLVRMACGSRITLRRRFRRARVSDTNGMPYWRCCNFAVQNTVAWTRDCFRLV